MLDPDDPDNESAAWLNALDEGPEAAPALGEQRRGQMVDRPTDLDMHRGMAAQKATELRRHRIEVEKDHLNLQARREQLEALLAAAPAETWPEAVEKARYLLGLFAETPACQDPRRKLLVKTLLADFERLLDGGGDRVKPI